MPTWRRGSTPTNIFHVNINLVGARIYVTYKQNGQILVEKTNESLEILEDRILSTLTQEETLLFKTGPVRIQIRYVRQDGTADASNIIETRAEEILKDGEIEFV